MKKTWKPTVGGILSIICGSFGVLAGLVVAALGGSISWLAGIPFATSILTLIGSPMIVLGVIAIVGGICSIRRTAWGMALAGAICALLVPPPFILGILAIVFITMSHDEFK
jgi:hypothetical protein